MRDVLFIEDIARLIEAEIRQLDRIRGEVFNIGGGPTFTLSLREATVLMEKRYGRTVPAQTLPEPRKADHCIYISDIRKARQRLGWEPRIPVAEGYERIIRWIEENERELARLYARPSRADPAVVKAPRRASPRRAAG